MSLAFPPEILRPAEDVAADIFKIIADVKLVVVISELKVAVPELIALTTERASVNCAVPEL